MVTEDFMQRLLIVTYGFLSYVIAMLAIVYSIAFVGDLYVPMTIDIGRESPAGEAIAVDLVLLGLFALQHSGMARQPFKRWLKSYLPAAAERSTYVLVSALLLFLIIWQWRPLPQTIWSITSEPAATIIMLLFWLGWAIVLISTFLIDHFELFGLKQVIANWQARAMPQPQFKTPYLYKLVRHPIYLGFLLAFWATPHMTAGHLLFAIATTGYILIGIWLEEHDLVGLYGDAYCDYRRRVPMIVPWPKGKR
jgi:protein-S-isoprenylcysteine O-methyltransferase Ste14